MLLPYYQSFKYSIRRYYVDRFLITEAKNLSSDQILLDIGGHRNNTRGQFKLEDYHNNPLFLNLVIDKLPDIQADAKAAPLTAGSIDVIFCSEVLEHVPSPPAILTECYRILKPQGKIVITVPFLVGFHSDPYDYGRYTHVYWQETLESIGFEKITIKRQGLFWSVLVDLFRSWINFQRNAGKFNTPGIRGVLTRLFARARRWAVEADDRIENHTHPFLKNFTTGYGITASKP